MEYILFLTYRCNMNCEYCFAKKLVNGDENRFNITTDKINAVCKYIEKDIELNNRDDNSIVFFGGEPSLVPDIILEIIQKTSHLNLKYSIYTNGLILDELPDSLLTKLHSILVAIDGDKKSHETYKPIGSYNRILNNVKKIKHKTKAQLIARITMEENSNIYYSVKNILEYFDFVHWQIVNKERFINPNRLINEYKFNVCKLFEEWKENLRSGVLLKIIPFNRIVLSLLLKENLSSFRCGCGSTIQAIDLNGNIYSCDEYVADGRNSIGNIGDNKYNLISHKSHIELFEDCSKCNISSICLGRCRKILETQTTEHIRVYCALTKVLVEEILGSMDEIKQIIADNGIDLKELHTEIYNTEIIP